MGRGDERREVSLRGNVRVFDPPRLPPRHLWPGLSPARLWQGREQSFNCYCFLPATIETYKSRSGPAVARRLAPSEEVRGKEANVNNNSSSRSDSLGKHCRMTTAP